MCFSDKINKFRYHRIVYMNVITDITTLDGGLVYNYCDR